MNQDTIWILLPIILAYIINRVCKSPPSKHKTKPPIQPPKIPNSRGLHVKTTTKPQEIAVTWEKEDSLLPKDSSSRSKKILNRSCLRQSILTSEILGRKY